jgi:hypothetical protein
MNLDLDKAIASAEPNETAHTVAAYNPDLPVDQKENEYTIQKASQYWGYFNEVGDLKSALIMKAVWNVGKGWTTKSTRQRFLLERVDGWGKQTFDDILFNMDINRFIFGDSFAEIIRDDNGELLNLKVLYPGDIKTIWDKKGRIERYESLKSIEGKKITWQPNEIFHLTNNHIAGQMHGISDIDSLEKTILADDQSFEDLQKIVSFQAKPFIIFKMKTDDTAKISTFVEKVNAARQEGKDMFIPDDENLLSYEVVQVNPSSILLDWRTETRNRFYRQLGLPLILFGSSGSTESGGKMETFAHEQVFEYGQKYIENQVWNQLAIKLDLIPPTSLLDNLQTDQAKDGAQGFEVQTNDVTAGSGR